MINVDNAPGDNLQKTPFKKIEVVHRSMVKVENDPGSLTLTHGLQEWMILKGCISFEEECTMGNEYSVIIVNSKDVEPIPKLV